jgi:phage gpG-like protein
MGNAQLKLDLKKIDAWINKITSLNNYQVRLGVFGGSRTKDKKDMSLPLLAGVHEFGSKKMNIPERSFLRVPLKSHKQEITESVAIHIMSRLNEDNAQGVYQDIGNAALNVVHNAFATEGDGKWQKRAPISDEGGWMKNPVSGKPFKIEKGKPHPLLHDTGILENSIRYEVTGGDK